MLLGIGTSWREASLPHVGAVAPDREQLGRLLRQLCTDGSIQGAVGVVTCNRVEFFLSVSEVCAARRKLKSLWSAATGLEMASDSRIVVRHEADAARHLFRVACGIESLVVGEREILGQLRQALEFARNEGSADPVLVAAFTRAIDLGRRVRHRTAISRGHVSVASLAAARAQTRLGKLEGKRALIVGAGDIARQTALALHDCGLRDFRVLSRTLARAEEVARRVNGRAGVLAEADKALAETDIVIAATSSHEIVIRADAVAAAREECDAGPLVMVDFGVPANIDPDAAKVEGVTFATLADLSEEASLSLDQRREAIPAIELQIEKELELFGRWHSSRDSETLVADLHRRMETIREAQVARYVGLASSGQRDEIDQLTKSLMHAALHDVALSIRALGGNEADSQRDLALLRRVFGLPAADAHEGEESA